ncbi:CBS domain-containing protein [Streptomyces sp. NPDC086787]|uniref:CBS domain-containing protein n=1 Tax=Streptomyces sp. NPDC086787 TaxID=3365759 RepID=UPI0037FF3E78
MKHSKIGSLMVQEVVSVTPQTPFKEVAKLLAVHGLSGLPVVDADDRVLGVISESDLVLRQAGAESRTQAMNARELMSQPAITVKVGDSIAVAARTMAQHRVERLPVVDGEGRLVGIVTRRDLLQVFLRPDRDIRRDIVEEILDQTLWLSPEAVQVHVIDGVVTLVGRLERFSDIPVAVRLAREVDGVVAVVDRLTYRIDDSSSRPAPQKPPAVAGRGEMHWERSP